MSWPCRGLGLLLLAGSAAAAPEEKKPVPLYTNDDLARVSPLRDETGVSSKVMARPPAASRRDEDDRARAEAYWRREAESHRARMQAALDRIEDLRARIAEREARPPARSRTTAGRSRPGSGGSRSRPSSANAAAPLEAMQRRLAALEARRREADQRFEDRARREGALPGWLR